MGQTSVTVSAVKKVCLREHKFTYLLTYLLTICGFSHVVSCLCRVRQYGTVVYSGPWWQPVNRPNVRTHPVITTQ